MFVMPLAPCSACGKEGMQCELPSVIHFFKCVKRVTESEAAVQSADCTKTLLMSPAAEAEAAASLVPTRLMAEWALPCPAVPLLPPQWSAR